MNFVLDASVALSWLLSDAASANAAYSAKVLRFVAQEGTSAIAPATWWLELAIAIAKAERKKAINQAQAESYLEMLGSLGVIPDALTASKALTDTLRLARQYRLSSYGASYLEVALRNGLPLATLDDDLRKAAKKAGVGRFAEA